MRRIIRLPIAIPITSLASFLAFRLPLTAMSVPLPNQAIPSSLTKSPRLRIHEDTNGASMIIRLTKVNKKSEAEGEVAASQDQDLKSCRPPDLITTRIQVPISWTWGPLPSRFTRPRQITDPTDHIRIRPFSLPSTVAIGTTARRCSASNRLAILTSILSPSSAAIPFAVPRSNFVLLTSLLSPLTWKIAHGATRIIWRLMEAKYADFCHQIMNVS